MQTIVHCITRLDLGGAQQNTLSTCQGLDRNRFRVRLVYGPGGQLDEQIDLGGEERMPVPKLTHPIAPAEDLIALRALHRVFRSALRAHLEAGLAPEDFVIHTHCSKAGLLGRLAAAGSPGPVIHHIHGFAFHPHQPRWKQQCFIAAERAAGRVTDAFISVSEANLDEAERHGILQPHHVRQVIRSGMDLRAFRAPDRDQASVRESLGLPVDASVIVSVANLKPQKDPATMIRAFAKLQRSHPSYLLYAGDGPLRGEIEQLIRRLGLRDRVRLLGWRDDVAELMCASDVVALSSLFEGLPRSAVQAVAAKRPFVGTRVNGTPEIIRDGLNGFLVPPRDPTALANALRHALTLRPTDPNPSHLDDWDVRRMVAQQADLYQRLSAQMKQSDAGSQPHRHRVRPWLRLEGS